MQVPTDSSTYFHVPSRNIAKPSSGERPPQYSTDSEKNLVYAFVPVRASSMEVIPRNLEKEVPEAKYHVSIRMNCFMPSSYITTIHLGTDELGQKLGLFEMGMIAAPSSVRIGGVTNNTAIALTQSGIWGSWFWHPARISEKYHLRWEFDKRPCICRAAYGSKAILARFTPAVSLEDALAELEVMPNGRELMDHILLSLLIIERKRLTPGRPETTKEIFN
ncbi:hypothetical protein HYPSUDRAFT_34151 [Hypholoma sublateritium FD-334 SS-4]|uniref:Uncharacterized protein n=1 Tax=Hypholoma sublateritium (strain FD-334 SS-4) TaxID=945553 RepID=A0A0D2PHE3_HYPSF|nr:hypothetical protein HYPSUDRAFT_34151 [Hypholoma sublateritium FD-334 SS-4]